MGEAALTYEWLLKARQGRRHRPAGPGTEALPLPLQLVALKNKLNREVEGEGEGEGEGVGCRGEAREVRKTQRGSKGEQE